MTQLSFFLYMDGHVEKLELPFSAPTAASMLPGPEKRQKCFYESNLILQYMF